METRSLDPAEIERLYARNLISRRQFVAGLAALGMTVASIEALAGSGAANAQAAAPPPVAKYLVLIVLDAFRPDYMSLASMPTVAALTRSGVSYDRAWVGQIESLTPAGHASLSTGCTPGHTGVLGFEWRDPETRKEVLDGWPPGVLAGDLDRDLKQSGVDSIALALKRSDPTAKVAAVSSEKVYAADAMGGWAADYILHHQWDHTRNMLVPKAVRGHAPPSGFFQRPDLTEKLPLRHFTDWDYLSTVLALAAIDELRPRALMVNLPSADYYGHPYGGPASPAVFSQVAGGIDRNISRIVQAYKQAGIYDQTLFVVTADHAMVPNVRYVNGALTKSVVKQAGGEYMFHTGGTAAYIYLNNPARAKKVAAAMAKVPNVTSAYYLLEKVTEPATTYYYDKAPGVRLTPTLNAANHFLLRTFAGPRAPDVVAIFRENTIGTQVNHAYGDHGGLNWGAQHIPLIMSGPGVAANTVLHFPVRLIDVAPTILRLMGLSSQAMDGIVLADALTDATVADTAIQASLSPSLTTHQLTFIQQANDNIAEDVRAKLAPPPPLAPKP